MRNIPKTLRIALLLLLALLLPAGCESLPFHDPADDAPAGSEDTPDPDSATASPAKNYRISRKGIDREEIITYFREIAMSAEYGGSRDELHKWSTPIKYYVAGNPTSEDTMVLSRVTAKMNTVEGFPGISRAFTESSANLVVHFAEPDEYRKIIPSGITDDTDGFASIWLTDKSISKSVIGIRTTISQNERNSVIWEEMVQCTGLQNDSYRYPDSLYYQGYNEVQSPTTLDWLLFEVLYHPALEPGMSFAECEEVIWKILQ